MVHPVHDSALSNLWTEMDGEKGDLIARSEQYGLWTIPSITMDVKVQANAEADKGHVVVGARLVNHLSNRIADTMFPHDRPFFTLVLTPEAQVALEKEAGEENAAKLAEVVRSSTARIEQVAMRGLKMTAYRPQAVMAIKHMIITGNAVIKRMLDGSRVVYGVRDLCTRRGIAGELRECLLRDNKKFGNLPEPVRAMMLSVKADYRDDQDVALYSHYKLVGNRWAFQQAADDVMIDNARFYTVLDLPILSLTWSLARGEDYGRGLVEDNAIGFHNLDVLTEAMIDLMSAVADLKFLVRTGSTIDVEDMNNSARGSYHQGNEGDITVPDIGKRDALKIMMEAISKWERDLSQAFLLNSASTRDAERVTAEEVRMNARELESAYGGLYSRLALEWQQKESEFAIQKVNLEAELGPEFAKMFEVVVVTGLESLSREGQLDNLRLAISDLQMLEAVPEEIRKAMNPLLFAQFVFTNRTVALKNFMYTAEEMQANQQAEMKQQQALMNAEAEAKVAQAGGEAAVQADQP